MAYTLSHHFKHQSETGERPTDQLQQALERYLGSIDYNKNRFHHGWLQYNLVEEPDYAVDQNEVLDRYHIEFGPFKEQHPLMHPEELTELILRDFDALRCDEGDNRLLIRGLRWANEEELRDHGRATMIVVPAGDEDQGPRRDSVQLVSPTNPMRNARKSEPEMHQIPTKRPRKQHTAERAIKAQHQRTFRRLADQGLIDDVRPRNIFSLKLLEDPLLKLPHVPLHADGSGEMVPSTSPLLERLRRRAQVPREPLGDEEPGFAGISMKREQAALKRDLSKAVASLGPYKEVWQRATEELLGDMQEGQAKYTGRQGQS